MWSNFSAQKTAGHTYPSAGTYTITLEVVDTQGMTATASRSVTVIQANTPPVPAFTVVPTIGDTGTDFVLNAGLTADAQDSSASLAVRWDWESDGVWDTEFSPAKTAAYRYGIAGVFTITMQARDSEGLTASITQQVQVSGANSPPLAAFSVMPAAGDTATVFQADASACADNEDAPADLLVHWQWQAGGMWTDFSTSKTASHQYPEAGLHSITLEVFDTAGSKAMATQQVTVSQARTPPLAAFTVTPTIGNQLTEFSVDASVSTDPIDSQSQLQVRWDWEADAVWDTAFSTVKTNTHSYPADGLYNIMLEVRNSQGLSSTARQQVKVITPGGTEDNASDTTLTTTSIYGVTTTVPGGGEQNTSTTTPETPTPDGQDCREAAFFASQTNGPAPLAVQFTTQFSISGASYFWSFGDGTYSYAQNPAHTYKEPGTYTVILRVNESACTMLNLVTVEEHCPLRLALGRSGRAQESIATLLSFRDKVLLPRPAGMLLIGIYYQHAREISDLLTRDPVLKRRLAALIEQHLYLAAAAVSSHQAVVQPAQIQSMQEFLHLLAARGSPALRTTVGFIVTWINTEAFVQQLGLALPPR